MNAIRKFGLGLLTAAALAPATAFAAPCYYYRTAPQVRVAPAPVVARAPAAGERRMFSYEPGAVVAAPRYVAPRAPAFRHDNMRNSAHAANWKINQ
jgi:hypothetical protein